jgi:GT2 family glycosyltransferase
MSERSPAVAVVILARDHWPFTAAALRTLGRTRDVDFETVVIDNGSAPDVQAALAATAAGDLGDRLRLRCELNPENVGVASGRNQGARLTGAPLLAFLDNDVVLHDPGWLAALLDTFDRNPHLGALGGVLLNADADHTVQFSGGDVDSRGRVRFEVATRPDPEIAGCARTTAFCLGACLLTPHALFEASGGFDPRFDPMDFEDVDYCLRLADAGHPSAIALNARLTHHGNVTSASQDFARLRTYLVNGRRFVRRWGHRLSPPSASGQHAAAPMRVRS